MTLRSLWLPCLALAMAITTVGCGDDKVSNPAAPSSTSTTSLNLAGTWSGNFTEPGDNDPTRIGSWTATQTGSSVTGPLIVIADAGDGQAVNVPTTFGGTVTGNQLAATFTVAAGAIPDPSLAACAFSGTGTLTATASSISGQLAMTFPPACVGEDLLSDTPTGTWIITLSK
ncbi:MAG: hypothetical protein AB7P99_05365 [Vicinamibacterales bacterium]